MQFSVVFCMMAINNAPLEPMLKDPQHTQTTCAKYFF